MNHVNTLLAARYGQQTSRRTPLAKQQSTSSIESNVGNNNTSIELPEEIETLIVGSDYWCNAKRNRYKMLARQGHLNTLLKIARTARTKSIPAHWFARACSLKHWETKTLPYLAKLAKVQETAVRVAEKLHTEVTKFIYKQVWQGVNVERWADTAAEVGRHKGKHFAWLCKRELDARAVARA